MKNHLSLALVITGATLILAGCSTATPLPLHRAADFRPESMKTVYVMPVVDSRVDKKLERDLSKLQHWVTKNLQGKHYDVKEVTDKNAVAGVTDEDLKDPTADWIKSLGPTEARWLMLVDVDELSRKLTFGSTGQAEVGLVVFDKESGAPVWRDKALGREGQGGLLGMMMVSMMDEAALESAMTQLMAKFPNRR